MVLLPSGENVEEEEDVAGGDDRVLGNGTSSSIAFHGNSSSQGNCWKCMSYQCFEPALD